MIALALTAAACLAVGAGADNVVTRDLAPAFPGLETVAADSVLSPAPMPGATRVFLVPELRRIAAAFKLESPESDICIQRPVTPLVPETLLAAMRRELPEAAIELLDFSRQPAPEGEIEFHRAALRNGPGGGYWTGSVRYAPHRQFTIWAKVKITVKTARAVAIGDLRPGKPITAGDFVLDEREEFPDPNLARTLEDVTGRWPRILIRAGAAIRLDALESPRDVMRGETVRVAVQEGGARIELDAQAEASGSIGDTVVVRNPLSNKRFPAQVEGKGRVSVKGSATRTP